VTLVEALARERAVGVSRLGLEHGRRCLGCCRALMLLLLAGLLIVVTGLNAGLDYFESKVEVSPSWVIRSISVPSPRR